MNFYSGLQKGHIKVGKQPKYTAKAKNWRRWTPKDRTSKKLAKERKECIKQKNETTLEYIQRVLNQDN